MIGGSVVYASVNELTAIGIELYQGIVLNFNAELHHENVLELSAEPHQEDVSKLGVIRPKQHSSFV